MLVKNFVIFINYENNLLEKLQNTLFVGGVMSENKYYSLISSLGKNEIFSF